MDIMEEDKSTEDRIFEAATLVFIEKGMDGARMTDIADRAGINKSLLNYYYRSKDRLFNAVFEMIALKMLDKFAPVLDKNLPLEDKLRFFFKEHIAFLQKNPRLPLFLLNEISRNPDRLKRFISKIDMEKVFTLLEARHMKDLQEYNITREDLPQLITTIVSMSVFPFAAQGIVEAVLGKMGMRFDDYLEKRKTFAADFVFGALKNMNRS
jgi:TetR/AcrR family transcriptional regulator